MNFTTSPSTLSPTTPSQLNILHTIHTNHAKTPTSPSLASLIDEFPAPVQQTRRSPVKIRFPSIDIKLPSIATIENGVQSPPIGSNSPASTTSLFSSRPVLGDRHQSIRMVTDEIENVDPEWAELKDLRIQPPFAGHPKRSSSLPPRREKNSPIIPITSSNPSRAGTPTIQIDSVALDDVKPTLSPRLRYHHNNTQDSLPRHTPTPSQSTVGTYQTGSSEHTMSSASSSHSSQAQIPRNQIYRQQSSPTLASLETELRGRRIAAQNDSPTHSLSPTKFRRHLSSGRSPEARPMSYVDLLNMPYSQQVAHQNITFDNAKLRSAVGTDAALLDTRKTIEMYRANVKKTNDLAVQYEFAIYMVNAAQEFTSATTEDPIASPKLDNETARRTPDVRDEMLKEARQILQRLADKSYVFAQYYLGDGYASGVFNKGKENYHTAFNLFVSAGKHGHAEAGYRAALCYEFGWGCRKDPAKAVQFYRQSASKNHPGAAVRLGRACLAGDMGLGGRAREGITWLKRASESADAQHNSGPYELGLIHLEGLGDDVFKDEAYAAQLFTRSGELGHAQANLRMGEAYERGLFGCPKDPALSIHFYTAAAEAGIPEAMMALCAWYIVGAPPLLPKDEAEAYEWAKQAARIAYPKAEYAVGYFTEMGIGTCRDTVEANVWYMRAAEHGDARAVQRLAIIKAAEAANGAGVAGSGDVKDGKKKWGLSLFDWKTRGKNPNANVTAGAGAATAI